MRGLLTLPILARELGVDTYGLWAQVIVGVSLLMPIAMMGLPSAMVRDLADTKIPSAISRQVTTVLLAVTGSSVTIVIVGVLLSFLILDVESAPVTRRLIFLAGAYLVTLTFTSSGFEAFRVVGRFGWYALFISLMGIFETAGVIVALALLHSGLEGMLVGMIIGRVAISVALLVWLQINIGVGRPKFELMRPYLIFGLPLLPGIFFEVANTYSDRYVIGFFHGNSAVAMYSVAFTLGTLIFGLLYPLAYVLAPATIKIFNENGIKAAAELITGVMKVFMQIAIPAVVGIGILGPSILILLATPKFVGDATQLVLFTVAGAVLFDGIRAFYGGVLILNHDTRSLAAIAVAAAGLNLVLNFALVPSFGIGAAAANTLVSYMVFGLLIVIRSRRYVRVAFPARQVAKSLVASAIMGVGLQLANPSTPVAIVVAVLAGIGVYFLVMMLIRGIHREDANVFNRLAGE